MKISINTNILVLGLYRYIINIDRTEIIQNSWKCLKENFQK